MTLFKKAETLIPYLFQQKQNGRSVGFVPTMGALHQGHLSLIRAAQKRNDLTVCSIFVNPTQFNNPDDFARYPKTMDKDVEALLAGGCDVLFLPAVGEIYPPAFAARRYELGALENVLEGKYRPGHFQGVCQVMDRLLEIVAPAELYLGQKDYQQCMVIERVIALLGKAGEVSVNVVPTVRETDGLAMSSRNLRLTENQREKAPALYKALRFAKDALATQSVEAVERQADAALRQQGFAVDYFAIADAATLLPATDVSKPMVALVAAHLDGIRLIDNLPLN